MPLISMRQTITITKAAKSSGWGHSSPGAELTVTARVSEQTKTVTNQFGDETVSSMTILIDKLADVSYDDEITYTNELGVTIKRKPIAIQPKRGLSGKALITEVNV
ncbi:hypothetical protein CPY53_03980 [Paenibacillus polymyxa]|nr:hypothetical protein CPY53_03980 [Paenibacillus polymyxa]